MATNNTLSREQMLKQQEDAAKNRLTFGSQNSTTLQQQQAAQARRAPIEQAKANANTQTYLAQRQLSNAAFDPSVSQEEKDRLRNIVSTNTNQFYNDMERYTVEGNYTPFEDRTGKAQAGQGIPVAGDYSNAANESVSRLNKPQKIDINELNPSDYQGTSFDIIKRNVERGKTPLSNAQMANDPILKGFLAIGNRVYIDENDILVDQNGGFIQTPENQRKRNKLGQEAKAKREMNGIDQFAENKGRTNEERIAFSGIEENENQDQYSDIYGLFSGNQEDFFSTLQTRMQQDFLNRGMQVDFLDPNFQRQVEVMKQSIQSGVVNTPQEVIGSLSSIASQYAQPIQATSDVPLQDSPQINRAEIEQNQIQENKIKASNIIGYQENQDGSGQYMSHGVNIPVDTNGDPRINQISDEDLSRLSIEDFLKVDILSQIKFEENAAKEKIALYDRISERNDKYYEQISNQLAPMYDQKIERLKSQQAKEERQIEYQKQLLEVSKARNLEEMQFRQSRTIEYQKARLDASGASGSKKGLMFIGREERKWADTIADTTLKYDIQLNEINASLFESRENLILDIEDIHLDHQNKLIEFNRERVSALNDLDKSITLTEQEKVRNVFDIKRNYASSIQKAEAAQQEALAAAEEKAYKRSFEQMKFFTEQRGVLHTIDDQGRVVIDIDAGGNPIMTSSALKFQFDIAKEQNDQDRALSKDTGYMHVDGVPVIDSDGNLMATFDRDKFDFNSSLDEKKFNFNSSLDIERLNIQKANLDIARQKLDSSKVSQSKTQYDRVVDKNGEILYISKPGTLPIGDGNVTGYGSPKWKWGLDIDGQKGDPLVVPFGGEVVFAGKNGGFGNQVRMITEDDNYEVWFSHLDDIFVDGSSSIEAGVIGTIGNTGTTIPGEGGDGSHVDVTIVDRSTGQKIPPEDVERFLKGKTSQQVIRTGIYSKDSNTNINIGDIF